MSNYHRGNNHYNNGKAKPKAKPVPHYNTKFRPTEALLNTETWVDADGVATDVAYLEEKHLHAILQGLYTNRDRYWLNCKSVETMNSMRDGDAFFQKVIRHSTLWKAIMDSLSGNVGAYHAPQEDEDYEISATDGNEVPW